MKGEKTPSMATQAWQWNLCHQITGLPVSGYKMVIFVPRLSLGTSIFFFAIFASFVVCICEPIQAAAQEREISNSIGMKLVLIPAGGFLTGGEEEGAARGMAV